MDRETFAQHVREALAHLQNRLHLARHPLCAELGDEARPLTGDALRQHLLDAIEQLRPIGKTPALAADSRQYRHLILRYCEGHSLEQVARALGVSVRQATRDHRSAVDAIVDALWLARCLPHSSPETRLVPLQTDNPRSSEREAQLAAEVAKVTAAGAPIADVAETLDGVVATLANLANARGVTFSVVAIETLPPAAINPVLLRQALLNLLMYATEVAPGGQLHVVGVDSARGLTLRIAVRGMEVGIRPHAVATSTTEATDLLAAGRQLLESQGGAVETGAPEVGSPLLTLILPPIELPSVLVIDDNPDVVALFRRYLRDRPYRVVQATSGANALRMVRKLRPDVIILDVMLPSQDGWEILQELRREPELREVPVVVCSVLPERALALSLGVAEFLPKPVTRPALLDALARCSPSMELRQGRSSPTA